ncbi:response regulator transcription factor [Rhodopirellula bahusiensis]|uniref:DNA-binding response regulator n=2 Tax=Rhodopirellula bahusiensis TaxID=2014065 RepID=A0A2G1WE96_9BACT|nr:response regulator [Rhodopirellula bahusiensis]PHQ36919.1 DNA-binding response regulator [Rhodopirellula bahusiensis]
MTALDNPNSDLFDPNASPQEDAGPEPVVYMVDDQQAELDLLQRWCSQEGLKTETFNQAEDLLKLLHADSHGCVVADLRMPRLSGLELQAEMSRRELTIPVILVTGHGDAENCRAAFQQGVFDFIEKGFRHEEILHAINSAIRKHRRDRFRYQVRKEALDLLRKISPRETEVMLLLAGGSPLKGIAQELSISVQTASKHRGSIFTKLGIDNEVDLYKMLLAAEVNLDAGPAALVPPAS